MITYRLADSLPRDLLEKLRAEHAARPESDSERTADYRKKLEALMDAGHGSSLLRHPVIAEAQVRIWREDAPTRYDLVAFVVMPTHVHLMIRLVEGQKLGATVRRWKLRMNNAVRHLKEAGILSGITPPYPVWHDEYFDRDIRDETHFHAAAAYIHNNPVKAGLCAVATDWPYSSANHNTPG
jgi:REP element-mobilizing transposase RayT